MRFLTLVLLLVVTSNASVTAQDRPTHEIHAAMVFNFIKYIQWPNEAGGGDFVVGVLGDEPLFNTLKQWYDGKPKGSKKYVIRKLATPAEAGDCSVVYLSKSRNRDFDTIKGSIAGKSVLTITDGIGMAQKGACINFRVIDGKLKFELNHGVVSTANLKVASQLASMAIEI